MVVISRARRRCFVGERSASDRPAWQPSVKRGRDMYQKQENWYPDSTPTTAASKKWNDKKHKNPSLIRLDISKTITNLSPNRVSSPLSTGLSNCHPVEVDGTPVVRPKGCWLAVQSPSAAAQIAAAAAAGRRMGCCRCVLPVTDPNPDQPS